MPLLSLLQGVKNSKKTSLFEFGLEALKAFKVLKDIFTKVPVLTHYTPGLYIIVKTNILVFTIRGVLSQLYSEEIEGH